MYGLKPVPFKAVKRPSVWATPLEVLSRHFAQQKTVILSEAFFGGVESLP
jgi:hypothetical protein